jgi:hypothetical protein
MATRPVGTRKKSSLLQSRGPVAVLFGVLLGVWMLFPITLHGVLAEDANPFVAAGRIARSDPQDLYVATIEETPKPALMQAECTMMPAGTNCPGYGFPYLAPPQLLPVLTVVAAFGDQGGLFLFRLAAVGSFALGMAVLWKRFAARNRQAELPLLITAALLTPQVLTLAAVGSTSPLMFLSGCLGLAHGDRGGRAASRALVWLTVSLFKLFPFALVVLAVANRRWRFLAWAGGALAGLTVLSLVFPTSLYGDFFETSRAITASRVASHVNVSIDSLIHAVDPDWRGTGVAFYALVVARIAALAALFAWKLRRAGMDAQWAWLWLALLTVHPQVWWHYSVVIVPAAAYVVTGFGGLRRWAVPIGAASTLPLLFIYDYTVLRVLCPSVFVAATVGLALAARPVSVETDASAPRAAASAAGT